MAARLDGTGTLPCLPATLGKTIPSSQVRRMLCQPHLCAHQHTQAATFKLLRAIGIGFAVSLFFGTIPFLDLLQLPEKGGALGWAVYTAAYLWAMLALLRFGKLNMDQPFSVLPDNSELAAEVCVSVSVCEVQTTRDCFKSESKRQRLHTELARQHAGDGDVCGAERCCRWHPVPGGAADVCGCLGGSAG